MLINLRNALMAGKRKPTAKDYVQPYMTRFLDGIENGGFGVHHSGDWIDLITGNAATLQSDSVWQSNCLQRTSRANGAKCMASFTDSSTNNVWAYFKTIEIVARITSSGFAICEMSYSATRYGDIASWSQHSYIWSTGSLLALGRYSAKTCPIDATKPHTYAFTQDLIDGALKTTGAFVDGVRIDRTAYNDYWTPVGVQVGGTQSNRAILGEVYGVREYDVILSDAEIAAKYAIDKIRFGLT